MSKNESAGILVASGLVVTAGGLFFALITFEGPFALFPRFAGWFVVLVGVAMIVSGGLAFRRRV